MSRCTATSRLVLPLLAFVALSAGADSVAAQAPPGAPEEIPPPVPREFELPEEVPLPDDLEVVIIREDLIPGQFRILDIRLSRAVGEDELATLAAHLRDADTRSYQRTYIVYYLPGMQAGAGGWATSHFTPELDVRVLEPER